MFTLRANPEMVSRELHIFKRKTWILFDEVSILEFETSLCPSERRLLVYVKVSSQDSVATYIVGQVKGNSEQSATLWDQAKDRYPRQNRRK